jgi:hypothetical protein
MRPMMRNEIRPACLLLAIVSCLSVSFVSSVRAELQLAPLQPLPDARLVALASILRTADIALLEANPNGRMRQITTLTFVAAPPALVREVVIHPERYTEFVRNMTRSTVQKNPDGSLEHFYNVSYSVATIYGRHRLVFLPPAPGGDPRSAPVQVFDSEDNGVRHYRWEFLPVPGGTLLVMYGFTPIPDSGIMGKLMARIPTLEYGLALITQLTQALAMRSRAEQLAGPTTLPPLQPASGAAYGFLLDRGSVVLMRTNRGRLSDVSMIERTRARPDVLLRLAGQPAAWSQFVPSITRSVELETQDGVGKVELEQSLPLMSWKTIYGIRTGASAVDMLGLSGDLRDARIRWDVRPEGKGAQVILRTNKAFDRTSLLVRQLYKLEPLFEYGVNVGLDILILWGVKARAEQQS